MTISLRLNKELVKRLEAVADKEGVSKSELIRQCLEEYLANHQPPESAWELGKDLFDRFGSGQHDMARRRISIVKEKIRAKANHG